MGKETKRQGVSLRPEDAVDSGLWMGGKALIEEAVFTEYDYGGTVRSKKLPVVLLITYRHAEGTYEQPYSCGEGWSVEKGGDILIPLNGQKGLPKSCNAIQFFKSLEDAGYDLADLDETVHALEGQGVECSRQAQPDRDGFQSRGGDRDRRGGRDDDKKKDDNKKSFILIDNLLDKAPTFDKASGKATAKKKGREDDDDEEDEKPKRKGRAADDDEDDEPKGKSKSKSKKDDDEDDDEDEPKGKKKGAKGKKDDDDDEADLDEEAEDALIEVLEKHDGTLKANAVEEAVYAHLKGHPQRKQIAERAADEEFHATLKKQIVANGKTVVLK